MVALDDEHGLLSLVEVKRLYPGGSVESDARFGLLAVPVYWGLAVLGRRRWVERGLLAACSLLLVAATVTVPLIFP